MGRDINRGIGHDPFRSVMKSEKVSSRWRKDEGHPMFADVAGIAALLDAIVFAGDGIIVSSTSDGGAISVTVLSGTARYKCYATKQDELDRAMERLASEYVPPVDDLGNTRRGT